MLTVELFIISRKKDAKQRDKQDRSRLISLFLLHAHTHTKISVYMYIQALILLLKVKKNTFPVTLIKHGIALSKTDQS